MLFYFSILFLSIFFCCSFVFFFYSFPFLLCFFCFSFAFLLFLLFFNYENDHRKFEHHQFPLKLYNAAASVDSDPSGHTDHAHILTSCTHFNINTYISTSTHAFQHFNITHAFQHHTRISTSHVHCKETVFV